MPRHLFAGGNSRLSRLVNIRREEWRAVALSFGYFFSLLCSYYIIRPVRDEMGVLGGVENLQWLFTGTFIVIILFMPLFGWISSRFPRRRFLPWVYGFFISHLLLFFVLFKGGMTGPSIARTFFIWTSVFNLFVISVFWSFMADTFNDGQAKRLFPVIAAGGTLGAIVGPLITTLLVRSTGTANLILLSALLLAFSLLFIRLLGVRQPGDSLQAQDVPMGGGIFEGLLLIIRSPFLLGLCVFILIYTTLATFLYFQQAEIIRDNFSSSVERMAAFSSIDLVVNGLTLLLQFAVTGKLIKWIGLAGTLAAVPIMLTTGFAALGHWPVLTVLFFVQIIRRAGEYAIMRPASEVLFVVLSRPEKYKAKNVIDTAICRGGDAVSAWAYAGLGALGLSLTQIAWLAVPLALIWAAIGYWLGIHQQKIAISRHPRGFGHGSESTTISS